MFKGHFDRAPILPGVAQLDWALMLGPVSYTHLRAHETVLDLVCRLLLDKKKEQVVTLYTLHTMSHN